MPMKKKEDIPPGFFVSTNESDDSVIFKIQNKAGDKIGIIGIEKIEGTKTWYVSLVRVYDLPRTRNRKGVSGQGFGPFLYDLAMEYVSSKDNYLISNQKAKELFDSPGATSSDADKVWRFYDKKREDIEKTDKGYRFKEKINEQ